MGLFGKSAGKGRRGRHAAGGREEGRRPAPAAAGQRGAVDGLPPRACGNRFLDWMKGFIEIKPFKVEPRLAQMRWDEIRAENPLLYRNRHLGCFLCKHVDPLRACCPAPLQECTFFPLLFPIATHMTFLPFGQAVTSARHEELLLAACLLLQPRRAGLRRVLVAGRALLPVRVPAPRLLCLPRRFRFTGPF